MKLKRVIKVEDMEMSFEYQNAKNNLYGYLDGKTHNGVENLFTICAIPYVNNVGDREEFLEVANEYISANPEKSILINSTTEVENIKDEKYIFVDADLAIGEYADSHDTVSALYMKINNGIIKPELIVLIWSEKAYYGLSVRCYSSVARQLMPYQDPVPVSIP